MIKTSPKPHFNTIQPFKRQRERRRPRRMTLIAAFRSVDGGVLLCSDRLEDDGISKRAVDKIYRVRQLPSCELFIAGAGPSTPIKNAYMEIETAFRVASTSGRDEFIEHRDIIESALKAIYKKFSPVLKTWPMHLIVVVAPRANDRFPLLYETEEAMLSPVEQYVAHGSGKAVSDYIAGVMFPEGTGLAKKWLAVVAVFIFRECGESSSGVGFGSNMILIHDKDKKLRYFGGNSIKKIESDLPPTRTCLFTQWVLKEGEFDWLNDF